MELNMILALTGSLAVLGVLIAVVLLKNRTAYLGPVKEELQKEKMWLRRGEYNAAMVRGRQNLELLLKLVAEKNGIQLDNTAQAVATAKEEAERQSSQNHRKGRGKEKTVMTYQQFNRWLSDNGYLDRVAKWEMNQVRMIGNKAVHENHADKDDAWNQYNYLEDILKTVTEKSQNPKKHHERHGEAEKAKAEPKDKKKAKQKKDKDSKAKAAATVKTEAVAKDKAKAKSKAKAESKEKAESQDKVKSETVAEASTEEAAKKKRRRRRKKKPQNAEGAATVETAVNETEAVEKDKAKAKSKAKTESKAKVESKAKAESKEKAKAETVVEENADEAAKKKRRRRRRRKPQSQDNGAAASNNVVPEDKNEGI